MDEVNKVPKEQTIEEITEEEKDVPENLGRNKPVSEIPAPKASIPKLIFIVGGLVAAIVVTVVLIIIGGGSNNQNSGGNLNENSHEHSFGEWSVVSNETCIADGKEERVCGCGEKESRTINACGHKEVVDNAVDSTCTTTGLTEGKHCSVCKTIIVAQTPVEKIQHTYDDKYDENCNVCGYKRDAECFHSETETINGYAASCATTGLTDGTKCKKCGEILTEQTTIPMSAHTNYSIPAVDATCTQTGFTAGTKCSVCNKTLVAQQETPKTAHTYDDKYDETCNKCGFVRDAECAHREIETINGYEATCTATGLTDGTKCKKCGEILIAQTIVSLKPHTEVTDAAVAATCTATGLTSGKHCSVCNKVIIAQTVTDMKPHIEATDVAVEATCTSTGLSEGKHCSVCNKVIVAQIITDTKPHTEVTDAAVAATCTTAGLTEGKHCSVCSKVLVAQQATSTINHIEGGWIVDKAASVTEDGSRHTECSMCGKIISEDTIPATGSVGLAYTINSDNTSCTITGLGTCSDTNIVIPAQINDYQVTAIGERAFADCTSIVLINIPNTVKTIGTRAFYGCTGLTEITIPNSITKIGTQIFYKANNLSTVYYNSSYSSVDNPFLNLSHIKKVVFGGTVVPKSILENSEYVEEVVIQDSVISIEENAFKNCKLLRNISLSSSINIVRMQAFSTCIGLENVYYNGSVNDWFNIRLQSVDANPLYNGANWYINGEIVTAITIPNTVTKIENQIRGCTSLKTIVLSNSVTIIGDSAFYNCTNLESVEIPDSVTKIDKFAFYNCASLVNINIPDSVTSIGNEAFYKCTSLKSILIPDSVTNIGGGTFEYCSSLEYVELPNSLTSILGYVFSNCTSLEDIKIPGSVTSMGNLLFGSCSSLQRIEIPNSVNNIDSNVFRMCSSLKEIVFNGTMEQWSAIEKGNGWDSKSGGYVIYCVDGEITKNGIVRDYSTGLEYTLMSDGKSYSINGIGSCTESNLVIPSRCNGLPVVKIGAHAFKNCTIITSISIPDTIKYTGKYAFSGCENLKTVYYGGTVAQWCNISFEYEAYDFSSNPCSNGAELYINGELLKDLVIPEGMEKIPDRAFAGCTSIVNISIPEGVTAIGDYAFTNCISLKNITFSNTITRIGTYAFCNCESLEIIELPVSFKYMGYVAFHGCLSLNKIIFEGTVSEWKYVSKDRYWNAYVPATEVQCSDGVVVLN